jgi:hypothetical protein
MNKESLFSIVDQTKMFRRNFYLMIAVVIIVLLVAIFTLLPIFQARTKWVQEAVISYDEPGRLPAGYAIDGNTLVNLTWQSDLKKLGSPGPIYIYTYNGKNWLQQAQITRPEEKTQEGYGLGNYWITISGDTILVGTNVFTRSGNSWSLSTKLQPPSFENLGTAQSIALDGDSVVISLKYAIHVFRHDRDTGNWLFEAEIKRIDTETDYTSKLAIDEDTIVDGFRVYRRSSTNDWLPEAELSLNGKPIRKISRVDISGNTIVVGMQTEFTDRDGRGTAHVFERNPNTGVWEYKTKLVPHDIVPFAIYGFGSSIDIDGSIIVAGHGFDVTNNLAWALSGWYVPQPKGRAYIFVRNKNGRWLRSAKLRPSNNQPTAGGVTISGNRVIIRGKDDEKLYIYKRVD